MAASCDGGSYNSSGSDRVFLKIFGLGITAIFIRALRFSDLVIFLQVKISLCAYSHSLLHCKSHQEFTSTTESSSFRHIRVTRQIASMAITESPVLSMTRETIDPMDGRRLTNRTVGPIVSSICAVCLNQMQGKYTFGTFFRNLKKQKLYAIKLIRIYRHASIRFYAIRLTRIHASVVQVCLFALRQKLAREFQISTRKKQVIGRA